MQPSSKQKKSHISSIDSDSTSRREQEYGEIKLESTAEKPSTMFHGDLYVVRVYTDESIDGHVYTHTKHVWYKNQGKTLCICHFYEDGTYRFVEWNADRVVWYQMVPERFEEARKSGKS